MAHAEEARPLGPRLLASIAVNIIILSAQLAGGLLAGSLALVADALHNLTDVASLAVSYGAYRVARRPATARYTFAFQRTEVLAAVLNAASLIGVSIYIAIEAVARLRHPEPVAGALVMWFALFGMVANAAAAWLLRGHGSNLNVRSAVLHLVSDSLASVGVFVAGLVMRVWGLYVIDPLVSLALAAWMTKESIGLLLTAAHILMQGVPDDIELRLVERAIEETPGVEGVHDLRVWAVAPENIVLSAHVVTEPGMDRAQTTELLRSVKRTLHDRFHVEHATLESEDTEQGCSGSTCTAWFPPPGPPGTDETT